MCRNSKSYSNPIVSRSAQPPTLSLFLLILLFHTSWALPAKIRPPPNSNLSVSLPPWAQGRLFAISDDAPFARHLRQDPDYVQALGVLTDFFASVQEQINVGRRNSSSIGYGKPCNVRPESWHRATHSAASNRGWTVSKVNGSMCVTDYYGVPPTFPLCLEQVQETLGGFTAVSRHANRIMLDTVGNWTITGENKGQPLEFPSQICELSNYGGFRLRGKWWAGIGLSNQPDDFHVPDGKRVSIGEVHRIENGTIVPALMTLPINPGIGEEHKVTDRATTLLTIWGGAINSFSRFEPSTAHENVGLKAALEKGANFAQQMEGVILASNIAILGLPLVLNLVPVSLISSCEKWRKVIYILLSDILTALPMFIKGIELYSIGNAKFTEIVTRMGDTFEVGTVGVEMWIASCRVSQGAQTIGTVFITVASLAMVLGVLLEVIASSLVSRARKRKQLAMEEMQVLEQFEGTGWKYYDEFCQSQAGWKTI